MKRFLPIILVVFLFLLTGFLFVWRFLPEQTLFRLISPQAKISAVSEVAGFTLKIAMPENLDRYLEGFGFWKEEGVFLRSREKKATVKRLVIHLTNKEQPFDKITGEIFENDGTYHLFIYIPSDTLASAPRENLTQAFAGYVLRSAFTATHYDPELSPEQNEAKIKEQNGVVNEILWLLGKARIFKIERR